MRTSPSSYYSEMLLPEVSRFFFANFQNKKGKKVAVAPLAVKKPEIKRVSNTLFEKRPRSFYNGRNIQPKRALVKWPKYIRLEKQNSWLRSPPPINLRNPTLAQRYL